MIYIVGGNGFVGSAYARYCGRAGRDHRVITRANFHEFEGTACDILINANGNSRKMLADREPLNEFKQSVLSTAETLSAFRSGIYVFLSSGDVYPDPSSPASSDEAQAIRPGASSRYGLHKRLAEELVMGSHPDWLVLRMGGFVGPGIRKNAIFDILSGGPVWLSPDSALQFIHTDHAAALAMGLVERGHAREIVNLGAEGTVRLGDIHAAAGSKARFNPDAPTVRFELSLARLSRLATAPLPRTIDEVTEFARGWPASAAPA